MRAAWFGDTSSDPERLRALAEDFAGRFAPEVSAEPRSVGATYAASEPAPGGSLSVPPAGPPEPAPAPPDRRRAVWPALGALGALGALALAASQAWPGAPRGDDPAPATSDAAEPAGSPAVPPPTEAEANLPPAPPAGPDPASPREETPLPSPSPGPATRRAPPPPAPPASAADRAAPGRAEVPLTVRSRPVAIASARVGDAAGTRRARVWDFRLPPGTYPVVLEATDGREAHTSVDLVAGPTTLCWDFDARSPCSP